MDVVGVDPGLTVVVVEDPNCPDGGHGCASKGGPIWLAEQEARLRDYATAGLLAHELLHVREGDPNHTTDIWGAELDALALTVRWRMWAVETARGWALDHLPQGGSMKGKPFYSMHFGLQVVSYRGQVEVWDSQSEEATLLLTASKGHMPQPYHYREDLGWWVHASEMGPTLERALEQGIRYSDRYRPLSR